MEANKVVKLSRIAVDLFSQINEKTYHPPQHENIKALEMQFIANMILELTNIAYPLKTKGQAEQYKAEYNGFVAWAKRQGFKDIPGFEAFKNHVKAMGL